MINSTMIRLGKLPSSSVNHQFKKRISPTQRTKLRHQKQMLVLNKLYSRYNYQRNGNSMFQRSGDFMSLCEGWGYSMLIMIALR